MIARLRWAIADAMEAVAARAPAIDRILLHIVAFIVLANACAQLGRLIAPMVMR